MELSGRLCVNLKVIKEKLGIGVTFDVIAREFRIGGKDAALVFVDGLIKDKVTQDIISILQNASHEDIVPAVIDKLLACHIPFFETSTVSDTDALVDQVLAGPAAILVDGAHQAIILDVREYPVRGVDEPDLERVTRGSHDGFVETVVFNTSLIRRRVRDPGLRFEMLQVGVRSKTDVAIGYINDVADKAIVRQLKEKIKAIKTDALFMGAKSLEEYLFPQHFNPLPRVRYTERPDVAAVHLFEGHVILIVDTTPMVMIVPVTLFHFTQHAEEYFQSPLVGTYLRWVRFLGIVVSLWLTPVWLSLYLYGDKLPQALQFIGPQKTGTVPVAAQFFLLEIGLDLIRMALIHTPSALATSLGIVGAILLGDLAVQVGLFVPETILYTAIAAIGYFAIPSIEFGLAMRMFRYFLLILAVALRLPGVIGGTVALLLLLTLTRTFNVPYLWPLLPLAPGPLMRLLFRIPVPAVNSRPKKIATQDSDESSSSS